MLKNCISAIFLFFLIVFIISLSPVAMAEQYGLINGHVTDKNGDPVSGAVITLQDGDYKFAGSTTTNAQGAYSFGQVPIPTGNAVYRIKATLDKGSVHVETFTMFFNVNYLQPATQDIVFENYPSSGKGVLYGVVSSYSDRIVTIPAVVYLSNGMYATYDGNEYHQWSFNLPAGEYVVWGEMNRDNVTYRSENQSVNVPSDDPAYLMVYLPTTRPVTYHVQPETQVNIVHGKVTQKNGQALQGTTVELYRVTSTGKQSLAYSTLTDSAGCYEFRPVDVTGLSEKFIARVTTCVNGELLTQDSAGFDVYYANTVGHQHDFDVPFVLNLANYGDLLVLSKPSGARVWIDGVDTGMRTPLNASGLAPGSHSVALLLDDYYNDNFTVQVEANSVFTANRTLSMSTGSLYIETYPIDSVIFVDNVAAGVGILNHTRKPCGRYEYTIYHEGYRNETGIVEVFPGRLASENIELVAVPSFSFTYLSYLISSMLASIGGIFS